MILAIATSIVSIATMSQSNQLRPPAIPLIAHDPYFSIWCPSETLNTADTEHWTHADHQLKIIARIDSTKKFQLLGKPSQAFPPLKQINLNIQPTQVIATFEGQGIKLDLTFLSASIATNLDQLATPLTYITWQVQSTDNKPHSVQIEITANGKIAANGDDQIISSKVKEFNNLTAICFQNKEQPILEKKGDRIQIDWGTCYLGIPADQMKQSGATGSTAKEFKASIVSKPLKATTKPQSQLAILA